jgi:hypothetical protein
MRARSIALDRVLQADQSRRDRKKAAILAERLLEQTAGADTQRPEMAQARKVLGR